MSKDNCSLLKKEVVNLLEDIYMVLPQEKSILLAKSALDVLPSSLLMDAFMTHIHKHKHKITARDKEFFRKDFDFGSFKSLQNILTHPGLTEDDITVIWSYFDTFVVIMDQHAENISVKSKTV